MSPSGGGGGGGASKFIQPQPRINSEGVNVCQANELLTEALQLKKCDDLLLEPEEQAYVKELLGKL